MKEQVPSDMAGGGGGGSQGQVQRGLVPTHVPHRAHTSLPFTQGAASPQKPDTN